MNMPATTNQRSLLVTGGLGFIGSAFAKRAASAGNRVVVLDAMTYAADPTSLAGRSDIEIVRGNITDASLVAELLQRHAIDTVVNFAAESHVDRSIADPESFMQTNILGVYSILNASLARFQHLSADDAQRFRFIQISTDEVFGSLGETGHFTEESPYDPRSPYSASKAAADHLVSAWHHTYGLPTITTYCTNNFGPYQYPEKLIPNLVHRALAGETLPIYGDGTNVRDWIYVEDHVSGVIQALERGVPGGHYAFGGGNERSNLALAREICQILDEVAPRSDGASYASQIKFVADRLRHDYRYAIDGARAESELGYAPQHQFAEALKATVIWHVQRVRAQGSAAVNA
jgi:dTDP-glucose 4,6-dehydratase